MPLPPQVKTGGGANILAAFEKAKDESRAALVAYLTGGYPTGEETVPLMLAMERGGADLIELGERDPPLPWRSFLVGDPSWEPRLECS